MARFQREAEVLASLDHPNIGHICGMPASDAKESAGGSVHGAFLLNFLDKLRRRIPATR
jgi:hypothetical protein